VIGTVAGTWTERVDMTLRDLEASALTTNLAGLRFTLALYQSESDLPARRRALQTALDRLDHTLRRARASRTIPNRDIERHIRAGIARWSDAAGALTVGFQHADRTELKRGERAGDAGSEEFRRARNALFELPAGLQKPPSKDQSLTR
jgi:hypothetical protein